MNLITKCTMRSLVLALLSVTGASAQTVFTAGSGGTILRSTNGGTNWTVLSSGTTSDLRDIDFVNGNVGYVVGLLGTIRKTTDGGASWTVISSGTTQDLYGVDFFDTNRGLAVGSSGVVLRTTNGFSTLPSAFTLGTTLTYYGVQYRDANNAIVAGQGADLRKTTDNFSSYSVQNLGSSPQGFWKMHFTTTTEGLIIGTGGSLSMISTQNGGTNWTNASTGLPSANDVFAIDGTTAVAVGLSGSIYKTTNYATSPSWSQISSPTTAALRGVSFVNKDTGYVAGDAGVILRTYNGGTTWSLLTSGSSAAFYAGVSTPPPAPPSGVQATSVTPSQVSLSWTDNSFDEQQFRIYRDPTSVAGNAVLIATVASGQTTYVDNAVASGVTYDYWVEAYNLNGSSKSNFINVSVPIPAVPAIATISPTMASFGTSLTITGSNFSATTINNVVYFGAVKAQVTTASATTLTVTVPSGATFGPISVTVGGLTGWSKIFFNPTFLSDNIIDQSSFAAKTDFGVSVNPDGIAVADFDNDGSPDVAVANASGNNVSILRNIGTGGSVSFTSVTNLAGPGVNGLSKVAVGDIDGDGKLDLVATAYFSNQIAVWRNTSTVGAISFAARVDVPAGTNPESIALGDLTADGKPDLVFVNSGNASLSVVKNLSSIGALAFKSPRDDFGTESAPLGVAIGDVDGDGKPDVVVGSVSAGQVSVYRNVSIGEPAFEARRNFATPNAGRIALGDLDNDGKLDVAVTRGASQAVGVFRNTSSVANVQFAPRQDFALASVPQEISIGDLDGDGRPELLVPRSIANVVSVFKNVSFSGSIGFTTAVEYGTGSDPHSAIAGDVTGDGRPEILATNYQSGSFSVLKNQSKLTSISEVEPNNFSSQSLNFILGLNLQGVLSSQTDVDYFKFRVTTADTLQFIGSLPPGSDLKFRFEIIDSAAVSTEYDSRWYSGEELPYGAKYLSTGSYYVRISHLNNYSTYFPSKTSDPLTGKEIDKLVRLRRTQTKVAGTMINDTTGGYTLTARNWSPTVSRPASFSLNSAISNAVRLNAYFYPADPPTALEIEYGTTQAYGQSQFVSTFSYYDAHYQSVVITGLKPGMTYFFREKLSSTLGTSYSKVVSVTLPEPSGLWAQQGFTQFATQLSGIDVVNDRLAYGAGGGDVRRTTNGGLTWLDFSPRYLYDIWPYDVAFASASTGVAVGWGSRPIAVTVDSGKTWSSPYFKSTYNYPWSVATSNGARYVAVGTGGLTMYSGNSGATWSEFQMGVDDLWDVAYADANTVVVVGMGGKYYRSTNGGFSFVLAGEMQDAFGSPVDVYSVRFLTSTLGFATSNEGIFKSVNAGQSWSLINSDVKWAYATYMEDAANGYSVGSDGEIFHTTNGWQTAVLEPSGIASSLWGVDGANGTVTVAGNGGVILRKGAFYEEEPNNQANTNANTISYNATVSSALNPNGDIDYFAFDASPGDTIALSTIAPPASNLTGGVGLWLYDETGNLLPTTLGWFFGKSANGVTDKQHYILNTGGKYFARVALSGGTFPNKSVEGAKEPDALQEMTSKFQTLDIGSTYSLFVNRFRSGSPEVSVSSRSEPFHNRFRVNIQVLPNGALTSASIQFGLSPSLGSSQATEAGAMTGVAMQETSALLTGLAPNTKVYFRAAATNAFGSTASLIDSFVTPQAPDGWVSRPYFDTTPQFIDASFSTNLQFGLMVGTGGVVAKTTDLGISWFSLSAGFTSTVYGVKVFNSTTAVAVGVLNAVNRTTDAGNSWTAIMIPGTTSTYAWRDISFIDSVNGVIVASNGQMARTTDAGATWTLKSMGVPRSYFAIQMLSSSMYIASSRNGFVALSTDAGTSWSVDSLGSTYLFDAVAFFDTQTGIVADDRSPNAFRTTDGGGTWNQISIPAPVGVRRATVIDANTAWFAGLDGVVYITSDRGNTWTTQPTGFGGFLYSVKPVASSIAVATGSLGQFFVRDSRTPEVTFAVDMRNAMQSGRFNRAIDSVGLRGSIAPLQWTGASHILTDSNQDSIYTITVPFATSGSLEYKFVIYHRGGVFWEREGASGGNRVFQIQQGAGLAASNFDDLPTHYFVEFGQYSPSSNTIGLYHLDEDSINHPTVGALGQVMYDRSGKSNHGQVFQAKQIPGRFRNARVFNGTNNYIQLESGSFYSSGNSYSFTVEAWIFMDQYPSVNSNVFYSGGKYNAFLGVLSSGRLSIGIRSTDMITDSSGVVIPRNRWVHVALVSNATTNFLSGFIDGELVVNKNLGVTFTATPFTNQAFIGSGADGAGSYFRGGIDEVRISDRAIAASEFNVLQRPRNLSTSASNGRVNMSWTAPAGGTGAQRYRIYRGTDSTGVAAIDSVVAPSTTYIDTTVVNGVTYFYRVAAVDSTNFEGRRTFAAGATPLPAPFALAVLPARNSYSTSQQPTITITMNADLDSTKVDINDVGLVGTLTGPMPVRGIIYIKAQRQLQIQPDSLFARGEQVWVTLRRGVTNLNGDSVQVPLSSQFWIAGSGGTGVLTHTGSPSTNGDSYSISGGDIDNDGDIDIVSANLNGSITVLKNDGKANLSPVLSLPYPNGSRGVQLVDLDNDGDMDVVVTQGGNNTISVRLNPGDGNFGAPEEFGSGVTPYSIVTADFNADGFADVAVTALGSSAVYVHMNNRSGGFITPAQVVGTSSFSYAITAGDFDRDGRPEFAILTSGDGTVRWYRNTGTDFAPLGAIVTNGGHSLSTADVNNDGNIDILVGGTFASDNVRAIFLNSSGALVTSVALTSGSDVRGVGAGDMNGDGQIDLVNSDGGGNRIRVWRRTGAGPSFTQETPVGVPTFPTQMVVADFDGDGDLDVVAGHGGASTITVLRNNYDTNPPATPTGLAAVPTSGRVTLTWNANSESDLIRYVIFRSTSPQSTIRRDSVVTGVTTYSDLSVTDSTLYFYRIMAVDASDNQSSISGDVLAIPHTPPPGEYVKDTSTVLLVQFAETNASYVSDEGRYNYLGTVLNGSAPSVAGKFGLGRSFSGGSAGPYIQFPSTLELSPTTGITVEAWVNPAGTNLGTIVRKSDGPNIAGYHLYITSQGWPAFALIGSSTTVTATSSFSITPGKWVHLAGSYSFGGAVTLYINGELVASTSHVGFIEQSSAPVGIGAMPRASANDGFNGIIDEVRITNFARQPSSFSLQLPPQNFSGTVEGTTINLSWQNGGGFTPLLRYRVYRGSDSTNVAFFDSTTSTSYSNIDLALGTTYAYRVSAVDITGTESRRSSAVTKTTSAAPQQARVRTFSGTGTAGSSDTNPDYAGPLGIALDRFGNAFVADSGNANIRRITPTGTVTTITGGLTGVRYVVVDSAGNIFASAGHAIFKNGVVYAGVLAASGYQDGDSTSARFNAPWGLALDPQGNLYVADGGNNNIRKITPSRSVSTIANGNATAGFADGSGSVATFNNPAGMSFDRNGALLIADAGNNAVRRMTFGSGGTVSVTTIAGKGSTNAGSVDGPSSVATFTQPHDVAAASSGLIYVADRFNHKIRRISLTSVVSTVAGNGTSGFADDTASSARFSEPSGLAMDGQGILYVADRSNFRIRRVLTSYSPSTFSGTVSSITTGGATLSGHVNPNGYLTTTYFEYGTTTAYGSQTATANPGSGISFQSQSAVLSGLQNNTLYHYRLVALNENGTGSGADQVFTTNAFPPPKPVLTSPDSAGTNKPTTITLVWNAASLATSYRIQLSLKNDFSSLAYDDSTETSTSETLTGLAHDTVYYWRVRAQNTGGNSAYSNTWFFRTVVDTPDVPTLAAPADNATEQPVSIALSWNAVPRATTYRLQVSPTNTFSTLTFEDTTLTGTSTVVSGLANLTTYYWRVAAKNVGGSSSFTASRQFTTIIALPPAPSLTSPLDGSTAQPTTITLTWSTSARATSYRLEVSTDSLFGLVFLVDTNVTTTSRSVSGLSNGFQYYWRVRAKNAAGNSAFTTPFRFRTVTSLADVPILARPDSGATNVQTNPTLAWRKTDRATQYHVQVSTSNTFASVLVNDSTLTDTVRAVTGLLSGTRYYWRARALNEAGGSSYSSVWHFTVIEAIPDIPTLSTPADSAINLTLPISFSWNAAARALTYRLEIKDDTLSSELDFVDSTITQTSRGVASLDYNTKYFWRVRSQNAGGNSSFSPWRNFRTVLELAAVPVLVYPDTSEKNIPTVVNLAWKKAPRASTYRLQVSLIGNFSTTVTDQQNLTDTTFLVGPLLNDTTYFWRVLSANAAGASAYSATSRFRTIIQAPDVPALITPADGVQDVPLVFEIAWNSSARASAYRIQISISPSFSSTVFDSAGFPATFINTRNLTYNTLYYWRVLATNTGGSSNYSTIRSFRTVIAPPSAPTLLSPADGSTTVITGSQFSWNSAATASSYHIQVSTATDFSTITFQDSTVSGTFSTVSGLLSNTGYRWRVRAKNLGGWSGWSSVRTFTTAPPNAVAVLSPRRTDFGSAEAGSATVDRTITLTNNGGLALNVTGVTITGSSAAEFSIQSGGGAYAVSPGSNQPVVVRFTPTSAGAKSAFVNFAYNAAQNPTGDVLDTLVATATDLTAPYNAGATADVNPATWSKINDFAVNVTPQLTDVSGIKAVWYAFDTPPTAGSPGTSLTLTGGSTSFQLTSVPLGRHTLYFYYEDQPGNKNPNQRYSVVTKFDNIAPTITHDSASVPEVTVTSGSASPAVIITAQGQDPNGGAGLLSFVLQYRQTSQPSFTPLAYTGPTTIPPATFVQNNGPVGVVYRLVAVDSANNQTTTRTFGIRVKASEPLPPRPDPLPAAASLPSSDIIKAYRIFSVPYDLNDKKPSSILPSTESLGPHASDGVNYANWRFQRYVNGAKEDYENFKDQDALTRGTGFFLIVKETGKTVKVGGGSVVSAQIMNDVGISLNAGWNLVGNPLQVDVPKESLQVTSGTIQTIAEFTGSGSSGWNMSPTTLKKWEGLAVKVSQATTLLIRTIGVQPGIAPPPVPEPPLSAARAASDGEASKNWLVRVEAFRTDNDMADVGDALGMVAGASEGIDRYDNFQPPFVGEKNVATYFKNGEESMTQDIRPPNADGGVWEMRLMTGDEGAKIRLKTAGVRELPDPSFVAFLIDLDQKMAYDLATTPEILVNSGNGLRQFRIVVGRKEFAEQNSAGVDLYPKEFELYANYPNPFNPETILRYTVSDGAKGVYVSLKVFDLLGREAASLVEREQSPGYYEVPFNASALTSGIYFYRLHLTDGSGKALYTKTRKMILLK